MIFVDWQFSTVHLYLESVLLIDSLSAHEFLVKARLPFNKPIFTSVFCVRLTAPGTFVNISYFPHTEFL